MSNPAEKYKFLVTTEDDTLGKKEWIVKNVEDENEASAEAKKAAALWQIDDYENYGNDSAYLNDLHKAADTVKVSSVKLKSKKTGRPVTCTVYHAAPGS